METYTLLDSGSDTSLVCEELFNQLGIEGKEASMTITTVNGTTTCKCLKVNLKIFYLDEQGSVEINKAYTNKKFVIDYVEPLSEEHLG